MHACVKRRQQLSLRGTVYYFRVRISKYSILLPTVCNVQVIEGVRNCDVNRIYCSGFNKPFIDSPFE